MVENTNGLSREYIIHPGENLKEVLENKGMNQNELAARSGVTTAHVSNIIRGSKSISVAYAKKLEYVLNIDASFWVNLQANYDKELSDFEEINNIEEEEHEILKALFDIVKYLKKLKFLEKDEYGSMLVISLRRLLNISGLQEIPKVSEIGAYRLARGVGIDQYVLFTWLRMCDLISEKLVLDQVLDVEKLRKK